MTASCSEGREGNEDWRDGHQLPWRPVHPVKVSEVQLNTRPFHQQETALVAPGAPIAVATTLGRRPASTLKLSEHLGSGTMGTLGTLGMWLPAASASTASASSSAFAVPGPKMPEAFAASSASRPPPGLELPQTLLESFHAARPRLTKRMKRMALTNLIRTPEGAEEISLKLDSATHSFCAELVAAILPELPNLACDPHGIQVLSKLLALPTLSQELRCKLAQRLQGSILKLTKDKYGCWFVQQAIQHVPSELQEMIQAELKGKILVCSQHLHGNFVLQKCVELLPGSISFIIKELKNHVLEAALHVYSCRVLQRLIEHCKHERPDMAGLFDILLRPDTLQKLVLDPYGNNVVRAVLACGNRQHVQKIVKVFLCGEAELIVYARNRHGSLVLERCLESLNCDHKELLTERNALMSAILGTEDASLFSQIALDRFGNYIVQRTIEICEGPEQQRVQELLNGLGHKLRRSVNGRHILQAARKKFGSFAFGPCGPCGSTLGVTPEDLTDLTDLASSV